MRDNRLDSQIHRAALPVHEQESGVLRVTHGRFEIRRDSFLNHASQHPIAAERGSLIGRTALEKKTVHLPDCLADPEYTYLEYQSLGKYRSMLGVPLLREGIPIGVIGLM